MTEFDSFSDTLLEEAKRFLEKGLEASVSEGRQAYFHAALVLGFCALEAYVNSIADEFIDRDELSVLDKSVLAEKDITLEHGKFDLSNRLKIYRLEDRIQYIYRIFKNNSEIRDHSCWSQFKDSLKIRNRLVHPKESVSLSKEEVERALLSIVGVLDQLFRAVYKKPFPAASRQATSSLLF